MGHFKDFVESNESDAKASIRKLPASHRALVRGCSFKFHPDGTLPGDDQHIGKVEDKPRRITLAAPWNYSRCFVLYHEIAHLVFAKYIKGTKLEKEWNKLCAKTKNKVKQNNEELFAHSYAMAYLGNFKVERHDHAELIDFIFHRVPK